jgi:hypothetical protein
MEYLDELKNRVKLKIQNSINNFQNLEHHEKIYSGIFLCFLICTVAMVIFPILISFLIIAIYIGQPFLIYALWMESSPLVIKIWKFRTIKIIFGFASFVSLIAVHALARSMVATAMGLPPQDFELTVQLCTIVFYIPVWIFLIIIFVIPLILIFEVRLLWGIIVKTQFHKTATQFGRFFALMSMLLISFYVFIFISKIQENSPPTVRWIAYLCDYHEAYNYPGIKKGERIRLHENGVISVASIRDKTIQINLRLFEQPTGIT